MFLISSTKATANIDWKLIWKLFFYMQESFRLESILIIENVIEDR